jgi:predicted transposase YdaD
LGDAASLPIGIATIKLIIENQKIAKQQAKELIARTKQQGLPKSQQQQLLDLIGTILVYKLPKIKKEELKAMFKKSDLRKTTFYQEVKEEVRQEVKEEVEQKVKQSISRLLAIGLTPEQIAQALDTSVEFVRQVVQTRNSGS